MTNQPSSDAKSYNLGRRRTSVDDSLQIIDRELRRAAISHKFGVSFTEGHVFVMFSQLGLPAFPCPSIGIKTECAGGQQLRQERRLADLIRYPAQQDSLATSISNVCAASFSPSTVVR